MQLYTRLVATMDSENFLGCLKSLHQASADKTSIEFPFKEVAGLYFTKKIGF